MNKCIDWTVAPNLELRFEDLVACQLLKWSFFMQDTEGRDVELRYFRDVDRREVDFVLTEDREPILFAECKSSSKRVSTSLNYSKKPFSDVQASQVTLDEDVDLHTF
jgi:predicted AAA+ superfamily ATPase